MEALFAVLALAGRLEAKVDQETLDRMLNAMTPGRDQLLVEINMPFTQNRLPDFELVRLDNGIGSRDWDGQWPHFARSGMVWSKNGAQYSTVIRIWRKVTFSRGGVTLTVEVNAPGYEGV